MKELFISTTVLFALIQLVRGEDPTFSFGLENPHKAKTNVDLLVLCRVDPVIPNAKFEWYDPDGNQITNVDSNQHVYIRSMPTYLRLHINEIVEDDAGSYMCKAIINQGSDDEKVYTENFILEVKASITFTECDSPQEGVVGREQEIKCSASAGGVAAHISWEKDGKPIQTTTGKYRVESNLLTILNVTKADAGEYMVSVFTLGESGTDLDSDAKKIIYNVVTPPKIIEPISEQTAVVGQKASLFCRATGDPLPNIFWYKEGSTNALTTTDRITVSENQNTDDIQGILEFKTIVKEDQATYTCKAVNSGDEVETSNSLIVHIPPSIADMDPVKGVEGSGAELKCEARGDPVPDMMWKRGDQQYTPGTTQDGVSVSVQNLQDPINPGAVITIAFQSLKHSDAGEWTCVAVNSAAEIMKSVDLEVRFKPNFDNQPTEPFYNWPGNQDGHLLCRANGNPLPSFAWFQGENKITADNTFYNIINEEENEEQHYSISKLQVKYNGVNDEVIGTYKCVATNPVGDNELTLEMIKGEAPGEPDVNVHYKSAAEIEVWLYEPTVKGPEVENFRITYNKKTEPDKKETMEVEREYREHIDTGRRYTKVRIIDLQPHTMYTFKFQAKNAVNYGLERVEDIETLQISKPFVVNIVSDHNSQFPTRIRVQWDEPNDGGSQILHYKLDYRRVSIKEEEDKENAQPVQGYTYQNPITNIQTINNLKNTQYDLKNLIPGSYYEVKVSAYNKEGYGPPGSKIIKTQEAEIIGESTDQGGLSTGAIVGIIIAIFIVLLIITDLTCFFKNNCGLFMSLKEKFAGGRGDDGYSAAKTDDVENLAKKDELTEEAKAAEEGELAAEDEKKEPLLSEEQKVDTVDEVDTKTEGKELEPEEKEVIPTENSVKPEAPAEEAKPEAPAPAEEAKADPPSEKPATESAETVKE